MKKKELILFLDYDGTLTPIVSHPDKAILSLKMRKLLNKLTFLKRVTVVLISGRSLADLKNKVKLKKVVYVGTHGYELPEGMIFLRSDIFAKQRFLYGFIKNRLKRTLESTPGLLLEDKKIILSIHYRMVAEDKKEYVKREIFGILSPFVKQKKLLLRQGKEVFELRPYFSWNKGKAVKKIINEVKGEKSIKKMAVIYVGDDETDEDAFREISSKGLTICVGLKEKTLAKYFLNDVDEVGKFLDFIVKLKTGKRIKW